MRKGSLKDRTSFFRHGKEDNEARFEGRVGDIAKLVWSLYAGKAHAVHFLVFPDGDRDGDEDGKDPCRKP